MKQIRSALVSVFSKSGLDSIAQQLKSNNIVVYSTGGTAAFLRSQGLEVVDVESVTQYPSILGGRVKTLHPKVFGGILGRAAEAQDQVEIQEYEIPVIDLVVVDLYPFEQTLADGAPEHEIIEKIDIGGISLIRAAAKNFSDVVIIPSMAQYAELRNILEHGAKSDLTTRKMLAAKAFEVTNRYDGAISQWFQGAQSPHRTHLRYGENPHQEGTFVGSLGDFVEQVHGKELSYNNLLDVDAAMRLMRDFQNDQPSCAIIKHNNACGFATRPTLKMAYLDALAGDPVSAFGGIIIANAAMDMSAAEEVNKLFCEVVIAPSYAPEALALLKSKKNRIILVDKLSPFPGKTVRSALNGHLEQDADQKVARASDLRCVTKRPPTTLEIDDLLFANRLVKHTKSNTIVLVRNGQLLASGVGQTSRVDALRQAISKANSFGFELSGSVMASDAFFPFPDCVEIAHQSGISAVIQPGGSVKDQESIDFCDAHAMAMVFTGIRHFKH